MHQSASSLDSAKFFLFLHRQFHDVFGVFSESLFAGVENMATSSKREFHQEPEEKQINDNPEITSLIKTNYQNSLHDVNIKDAIRAENSPHDGRQIFFGVHQGAENAFGEIFVLLKVDLLLNGVAAP